ncbi:glutathione transferase [Mesobaculum littorinae]|uniref:Glutathione transferase n=1 Tax=Mesobaculum littorinae TaxID=2486419 RepID=A0A438AN83_9RHOB|nr:VOC family protein [Mesobaculum littorinae]RVW00038.1 glutathione transferase [Mesobaculum littorinae]
MTGVNHLTLACRDLDRATAFYRDVLGATLRARWEAGAYLELGSLWLCLARGDVTPRADYTHVALSCAAPDFASIAARITAAAPLWQENRSEGASLYFLDPDGHRLELHAGDLASRLDHYRAHPEAGVTVI